ncbi:MAG: hypothetical protein QW389_06970 [Desulfurococcus sp.]|uniref:hypothetical protein n=1 Tax=Desulfurococcus sp. TaxID=51678 RepID=UPI003166C13C
MKEVITQTLTAYFKAEMLREHGFWISLIGFTLWGFLFIGPIVLFSPSSLDKQVTAGYTLVAMLVFSSYMTATWDWSSHLRWMLRSGVLEQAIVAGRSIYLYFIGLLPVSLMWLVIEVGEIYLLLTLLYAPPYLSVSDPLLFFTALAMILTVLVAHSLLLGASILASGTSNIIVEFLSWIIPIASGGLTPLASMPQQVQIVALATPYSYPAELLRHILLKAPVVMPTDKLILYGLPYALAYLIIALAVNHYALARIRRNGAPSIGMY